MEPEPGVLFSQDYIHLDFVERNVISLRYGLNITKATRLYLHTLGELCNETPRFEVLIIKCPHVLMESTPYEILSSVQWSLGPYQPIDVTLQLVPGN